MDVRLPDGTIIRGVPDGISKADLTAKLARNGYDVSKLGGAPADVPQVGADGHVVQQKPAQVAEPQDTVLGKLVSPVDAALSAGSAALGGIVGAVAGAGNNIINGRAPGARAGEEFGSRVAEKITRPPATQTGRKILEAVGTVAEPLGALPTATLADLAGSARVAAPAVQAAADVGGAAAAQSGARLSQLAGKVVPKMDPTTARLAAVAQERYGIPLRPDQLYGNKLAKMAGEASEKVPLSGSKADVRQEAFNKAVIGTIGGDPAATKLTPDVFDQAIRRSGQKIGDIAAKTPLMIDQELSNALDSHLANVSKYETSDVARVITNYIDELRTKAADGAVPGEAFRKLNTKITSQMRSTSNGDLKHALGELQDDLQDALQRGLSGDDLAALQAARQQYAIAKTIEPLVAKSATGDISPAGLMGRVTANNAGKSRMARGTGGEIGDLARIGQRFLKEPASSGTAERGLVYGLAGGGVVAEPATATGIYTLSNLYNRAGAAAARKLTPNLRDLSGKGGN